jgi:hypothetical protein
VLAKAHEALIVARANNDEADAMFMDWEAKNPKPASKRGTRKWLKRGCAYHSSVTAPWWQAMMEAEKAFAEAQGAGASVPIASTADVQALIACRLSTTRWSSAVTTARRSPAWSRVTETSVRSRLIEKAIAS